MTEGRKTYGTVEHDAAITREDFERAVRYLHLNNIDLRDMLLHLAAQVVALTEELNRRLDVEGTEAVQTRVEEAVPLVLDRIRASDARTTGRVWLEPQLESKYDVEAASPPCDELLHLCRARCCKLVFALTTTDLDEGVIRWDYGQPYMIRQRASDGYCVHNDPQSQGCTVHAQRPAVCRRFDCRNDSRIWTDFEKRIPAPPDHPGEDAEAGFDLMERVKLRSLAEVVELNAVCRVYPDDEPREGPPPAPRKPRGERNT